MQIYTYAEYNEPKQTMQVHRYRSHMYKDGQNIRIGRNKYITLQLINNGESFSKYISYAYESNRTYARTT